MMLTRRGFLGLAGASAGIVVPPTLTGVDPTKPLYWEGWSLRWLPWQRQSDQDYFVGFYVAQKDGQYRHWCTSGVGGAHQPGYVFNISVRPGWAIVTSATPPLVMDRIQLKTLRYLLAFLERPDQDPDQLILPDA